ncbi:MAG: ABC transporter permease [Bacillota bacterium]
MNNIFTVMRRELSSYFLSPLIYVLAAVFVFLYGVFFTGLLLGRGIVSLHLSLGSMLMVMLFMIPIMTMRSLAEEKRMGTDELIMTAPITTAQFVAGKFIAICVSFLIMLSMLGFHVLIAYLVAQPDPGPIIGSFLGLICMGLVFISVGLFTSSLSENQVVAGLLGFGILLLFWLLDWVGGAFPGKFGETLNALSLMTYYDDFGKGVLDTANAVYYLTMAGIFLFFTIRKVESRRWK